MIKCQVGTFERHTKVSTVPSPLTPLFSIFIPISSSPPPPQGAPYSSLLSSPHRALDGR